MVYSIARRWFSVAMAGGAMLFAAQVGAAAKSPAALSYIAESLGSLTAYLAQAVSARRVDVVTPNGRGSGGLSLSAGGRLVTLDTPISITFAANYDACNEIATQRQDTQQILFRQTDGSTSLGRSTVVELGTITNLDGCEAGKVLPFGALTDPGLPMLHRAMSLRAPVTDLLPGVALAGMAEDTAGEVADIVSFLTASRMQFQTTGTIARVARSDGWLVLGLPGFERGYTRLTVDTASGGEIWLKAAFIDGLPVNVVQTQMVKPEAGATFGSVAQTSRMWESSFYLGTLQPFFVYLYRDGNGERVFKYLDTGEESRSPITWRFDGLNVLQDRAYIDDITRTRTWKPLLVRGPYRFVMEDEVINFPEGPGTYILPRVNFYVDRGRATPLPPAQTKRSSPAVAAGAAQIPRKTGSPSLLE